MSIRFKVLSIAFALLLIFGIVTIYSTVQQHRLAAEMDAMGRYNMPIRTALSDFDVTSDEYELIALRLVRRSDVPGAELESETARARAVAQKIRERVDQLQSLVEQGVADERLPEPSRRFYSELKSALPFIARQLDGFIGTGEQVLEALAKGRPEEARARSLEFRKFEQAFGPDTAAMRLKLAASTQEWYDTEVAKLRALERISYVLFALAVVLGIGVGRQIAAHIVGSLRRLVDASKAVRAGERSITLPVHTNDELGQLAEAFNLMVGELRAKERIQHAFGMFVDPRLVANLVKESGSVEQADRQVVTVFFSDIAGFTSISEELTAMATVHLLNNYFAAITESIRASHGIVDKFIGDAVMAFWCAPFSPGEAHAADACRSALAQQEAIARLNRELPNLLGLRRSAPSLTVRMGIATGEVVLGTLGSTVAKSFTVIGDTVNLASRLESINKVFGTRIVVTESTVKLARAEVETRELDLVTVAGKTEPVRIYELLGPAGQLGAQEAELYQEFAKGLAAYRQRDWDTAERQFRRCLELNPKDGPSALYIERVAALRATPPPADWDGVWRFTHK
jgi:adenylate cyclase